MFSKGGKENLLFVQISVTEKKWNEMSKKWTGRNIPVILVVIFQPVPKLSSLHDGFPQSAAELWGRG